MNKNTNTHDINPDNQGQSFYHDIIVEATGCPAADAEEVEDYMRHTIFHGTLDWQTKEQLAKAAKQAWGDIEYMRSPEGIKYLEEVKKEMGMKDGGKVKAAGAGGSVDLFFGQFGNGISVSDKNRKEHGDYKNVAHISEEGEIKYYDKNLPASAVAEIEQMAKPSKMRVDYSHAKPEHINVSAIQKALNGSDFWMKPDSEAAKIIAEAVKWGYVRRPSHTQAYWTDKGSKLFKQGGTAYNPDKYIVKPFLNNVYGIVNTENNMFLDRTGTKEEMESLKHEKDFQRKTFGKESYFKQGGSVKTKGEFNVYDYIKHEVAGSDHLLRDTPIEPGKKYRTNAKLTWDDVYINGVHIPKEMARTDFGYFVKERWNWLADHKGNIQTENFGPSLKTFKENINNLFYTRWGLNKPYSSGTYGTTWGKDGIYVGTTKAQAKEIMDAIWDMKDWTDLTYDVAAQKYKQGGTLKKSQIDEVLKHYIIAALWAEMNTNDKSFDEEFSVSDIAPKTMKTMREKVKKFLFENADAIEQSGLADSQVGHSLWLTQNRHGAGFFDFTLPDGVEEKLTAGAHALGEGYVEAGDDGRIYVHYSGAKMKKGGITGFGSDIEKTIVLRSKINAAKSNLESAKKYFNKYKGNPEFGEKWEKHEQGKIKVLQAEHDNALQLWKKEYGVEYKMEQGGEVGNLELVVYKPSKSIDEKIETLNSVTLESAIEKAKSKSKEGYHIEVYEGENYVGYGRNGVFKYGVKYRKSHNIEDKEYKQGGAVYGKVFIQGNVRSKQLFGEKNIEYLPKTEYTITGFQQEDYILTAGGMDSLVKKEDFKKAIQNGDAVKVGSSGTMAKGGAVENKLPYSKRFFDVIETRVKDGTILRHLKNLNTYAAEEAYSKLANAYPVRNKTNAVKMVEVTGSDQTGNTVFTKDGVEVEKGTQKYRGHIFYDAEGTGYKCLGYFPKIDDCIYINLKTGKEVTGCMDGFYYNNPKEPIMKQAQYAKGGSIRNHSRDMMFKSQEPHEQAYGRKKDWKEYNTSNNSMFGLFKAGGAIEPANVLEYLQTLNAAALPKSAADYLRDELLTADNLNLLSLDNADVQTLQNLIAERFATALPVEEAAVAEEEAEEEMEVYIPEEEEVAVADSVPEVPEALKQFVQEAQDAADYLDLVETAKEKKKFVQELNDVIAYVEMENEEVGAWLKTKYAAVLELGKLKLEKEVIGATKAEAKKMARKLQSVDFKIWDKLKIESGSQLYNDIELQKQYKAELDKELGKMLTGKLLSADIYDILEDNNMASLIAYLSMLGYFGAEKEASHRSLGNEYNTVLSASIYKDGGAVAGSGKKFKIRIMTNGEESFENFTDYKEMKKRYDELVVEKDYTQQDREYAFDPEDEFSWIEMMKQGGKVDWYGINYNVVYEKPNSDIAYKEVINAKSESEAKTIFNEKHPTCTILSIGEQYGKGGKLTAKDEGCWFDSARGRYIGEAVIETAENMGFVIKPEDEAARKVDGENYEELWVEAEEYLNTLAPEGYWFGSDNNTSDWGLWKIEDEMKKGGKVKAAGEVAEAAAGAGKVNPSDGSKFNADVSGWFDELIAFSKSNKAAVADLVAQSLKPATRKNLREFIQLLNKSALPKDLVAKLRKQANYIQLSKYKDEFKNAYGGKIKAGDSYSSAAKEFYSMFEQGATYN